MSRGPHFELAPQTRRSYAGSKVRGSNMSRSTHAQRKQRALVSTMYACSSHDFLQMVGLSRKEEPGFNCLRCDLCTCAERLSDVRMRMRMRMSFLPLGGYDFILVFTRRIEKKGIKRFDLGRVGLPPLSLRQDAQDIDPLSPSPWGW